MFCNVLLRLRERTYSVGLPVSVDGDTFPIGVLVSNWVGGRCLDLAGALDIRNLHGYTGTQWCHI